MKPHDVKEHYVTWANAMRKLGLGVNAYNYWTRLGYIPISRQREIEKISKGKLKSDV